MTDCVIAPLEPVSVPGANGSGRFPVRCVDCAGQNYTDHASEMSSDPDRAPPFFFSIPVDALLTDDDDLHFVAELVVAICKVGRDIGADAAGNHIRGAEEKGQRRIGSG
ncbi:fumarylacetoacetate hydrolase family protein [Paracoccus wurundjeri]|uniref:fumarylacetoacetate hydrolase family protein n=1 Tax=Paracoccus onubensis TaxID=1675788 RepID=UPI003F9A7DFF